jgi:hypothetical protein
MLTTSRTVSGQLVPETQLKLAAGTFTDPGHIGSETQVGVAGVHVSSESSGQEVEAKPIHERRAFRPISCRKETINTRSKPMSATLSLPALFRHKRETANTPTKPIIGPLSPLVMLAN